MRPPPREQQLPSVADFLAHAKKQFGFVPKRASEREFKRSYAIEALKVGLTKDQVVRVYALETGGLGTYDMQSGTNPVTRQGKPISSALGYAQLLHANSTGELVKHGEAFAQRLTPWPPSPARRQRAPPSSRPRPASCARCCARPARCPTNGRRTSALPRRRPGLGIHTLNLDAEVGPGCRS